VQSSQDNYKIPPPGQSSL